MKTTKMVVILVLALGMSVEVTNADFTFGEPTNLGPTVNSSFDDDTSDISADGLELYFTSARPGGEGGYDIWVTKRPTTADDWGTPVNLGPTVNSSSSENSPSISTDGLTLYFGDWPSHRPGGYGSVDIWVTTRPTTADDWGTPVNLGTTVNSSASEGSPDISGDGLELYFTSNRPGGYGSLDIWVTTRATTEDGWGTPVNLGPTVNSSGLDHCSGISDDELTLFFAYDNIWDIFVTRRTTIEDDWGKPVNLGPTVNSSSSDDDANISADGSTLFFFSNRPGGYGSYDLWQSSITPIVDLNGDGIVDAADMCIMVDHWLTDEPLCDIGPMPWGDGVVDVQDLIVLAEHLFEEIPPVEVESAE
jgi:Tol biopolymer transport system component